MRGRDAGEARWWWCELHAFEHGRVDERVNARPAYSLREEVQILGVCETLHKLELHLESSVFGCRPCAISLHACCRASCAVHLTCLTTLARLESVVRCASPGPWPLAKTGCLETPAGWSTVLVHPPLRGRKPVGSGRWALAVSLAWPGRLGLFNPALLVLIRRFGCKFDSVALECAMDS
jgi:hypothetical protein